MSNGWSAAEAPVVSEILDRTPPHSQEAERGVIGSMLLDPEVCDEVVMLLKAEDFYSDRHQRIYGHLLEMHNSGVRVDTTLLLERLKKGGEVEAIGGVVYLLEIVKAVPHAANASHYAKIVQDKSVLRALIGSSTEVLRDCYDQSLETMELLARAETRIFSILENQGGTEVTSFESVLADAFKRIDDRLQAGATMSGLPSGFVDLDRMTGGLQKGELSILAGRPSMGKTALAANIAEHVAMHENTCVLFCSLEMSKLELAERMMCSFARVNGHKLRNGLLNQDERSKLVEQASQMGSAPLFIDDNPSRTMTEIAATARRLKRRHNLGLVVIDYLQLIEPDNARDPRQEQVAKIARRLKGLARSLSVPVLCLAQLNRQAEASKDNIPRLSHLRESGAIEQDADVVLFVHREEYYATDEEEKAALKGKAQFIISKQRNGPTGNVDVTFLADYARFENGAKGESVDMASGGW